MLGEFGKGVVGGEEPDTSGGDVTCVRVESLCDHD